MHASETGSVSHIAVYSSGTCVWTQRTCVLVATEVRFRVRSFFPRQNKNADCCSLAAMSAPAVYIHKNALGDAVAYLQANPDQKFQGAKIWEQIPSLRKKPTVAPKLLKNRQRRVATALAVHLNVHFHGTKRGGWPLFSYRATEGAYIYSALTGSRGLADWIINVGLVSPPSHALFPQPSSPRRRGSGRNSCCRGSGRSASFGSGSTSTSSSAAVIDTTFRAGWCWSNLQRAGCARLALLPPTLIRCCTRRGSAS